MKFDGANTEFISVKSSTFSKALISIIINVTVIVYLKYDTTTYKRQAYGDPFK